MATKLKGCVIVDARHHETNDQQQTGNRVNDSLDTTKPTNDQRAPFCSQRRKRCALAFVGGVLFVLISATLFYHWLTSPQRLANMVVKLLEENLGGKATVQSAQFQLRGPIDIQGIRVKLIDSTDHAHRLLEIDRITLIHNPWSLWRGRLNIRQVFVSQPRLYLTEFTPAGDFNWQQLFSKHEAGQRDWKFKGELPQVRIDDGQWVFGRVEKDRYSESARFTFRGRMSETSQRSGVYGFHLTQTAAADDGQQPLSIQGEIDIEYPAFKAELLHFECARVNKELLPSLVRQWWDKLQPCGALPTIQIGINPEDGPWAKLVAQQLQINLPLTEGFTQLLAREAQLAFRSNTLHIETLTGVIHGCDYKLSGFVRDFGPGMTMKLDVDLQGPVPHEPAVMEILPPVTRSYLKRFNVRGRFHTQMTIKRDAGDDHIISLGTLDLFDGTLSDNRNPYPMQNVTARIRYDHDAVVIERIDARGASGAVIHAHGEIRPPTNDGALDFVVTIKDAPVDQYLLGSLHDEEREIIDELISQPALQRLLEKGAIGEHQPFALDGKVSLTIQVQAPPGSTDTTGHITNTIELAGVKMLCDFWPYPLTVQSGQLVVKGRDVRVNDVQLIGLTGGRATLSGALKPDADDPQRTVTQLQVTANDVPIDELLLASLPSDEAQLIEQLGIKGKFDGKARIFTNHENKITFVIEPHVKSSTAQPKGTNFQLTELDAKLTLQPGEAVIDALTANHGSGTIAMSGALGLNEEHRRLRMQVQATDLPLEQGVLDLLSMTGNVNDDHLQRIRQYDLQGVVNASLQLNTQIYGDGKHQTPSFDLKLEPKRLNVRSMNAEGKAWRVPIENITGWAQVQPNLIELQQLQGTADGTTILVNGKVAKHVNTGSNIDSSPAVSLQLSARGDRLTPGLRALLPSGVQATLAQIEFQGGFAIHDAQLKIKPGEPEEPGQPGEPGKPGGASEAGSKLSWSSVIELQNASAMLGVAVTEFTGRLDVSLQQPMAGGLMLLDMRAQAEQVRVLDRLISPLSFQLLSTPGWVGNTVSAAHQNSGANKTGSQPANHAQVLDRLELRDLTGQCYAGKVMGSGTIIAGRPGGYSLQLVLDDAALGGIVNPRGYEATATSATTVTTPTASSTSSSTTTTDSNGNNGRGTNGNRATGRLSANLSIEGIGDDVRTRRGRGEMVIREARLFEVPMAMAMLQIMHLTWPASRAFDRASARYVIQGETVQLDDLRFEAPDLQIIGGGTVQFPGLQLQLDMFTRNPHRQGWGALGEALDMVRDGLISIRVTGTLDQPVAKLQSFSGVRRTWRELFQPVEK